MSEPIHDPEPADHLHTVAVPCLVCELRAKLKLARAENEAMGSVMLDLQRDCIGLRVEAAKLISSGARFANESAMWQNEARRAIQLADVYMAERNEARAELTEERTRLAAYTAEHEAQAREIARLTDELAKVRG